MLDILLCKDIDTIVELTNVLEEEVKKRCKPKFDEAKWAEELKVLNKKLKEMTRIAIKHPNSDSLSRVDFMTNQIRTKLAEKRHYEQGE